MLVQDFFVNSVQISGILSSFSDQEDGTGHILVETGENQSFWVYCDYTPTWEQAQEIAVGTYVNLHCAIKPSEGSGGSDLLIVRNLTTNLPPAALAGIVVNPKTKPTSKGDVMSFAISMSEKVNGEKVNRYYNCELWNEYLFKKIVKGAFVSITGSLRMNYYEDKEGLQRCAVTVTVHNVATPPPAGRGRVAPSHPPVSKTIPAKPPVTTKATTAVAIETDGVEF